MDKIIFKSEKALPNCDSYGIGVVHNGEVYLTPLRGIVQMRPQLNFLGRAKNEDDTGGNNEGFYW